ncbi:hypothetical protein DFP72DRAFT_1066943 [Ephemerocybe angulata]|uniref:Uncharacterized protein n=1 Tax=Ephemerocybe angulata TaxID=980116 RepID=A0A8H6I1B7_9AGAR|nr:hypothetical protein DFP72DRAFT_1066943 [Tulosesus angulatus]
MCFMGTKGRRLPPEMISHVLDYLPLRSLQHIVDFPDMENHVRTHLKRRLSTTLSAFGFSAEKAIDVMQRSGTILSGSAALEIVQPGTCTPEDLNFYCPLGSSAAALELISHTKEYQPVEERKATVAIPRTPFSQLNVNNGVKCVHRFRDATTEKRITLIESLSPSPLLPLFFFHLTALMNCVTGTGAVSFYPELTESSAALLNRGIHFGAIHKPLEVEKWISRDIRLITDCHDEHPGHPNLTTREKRGMCQWAYRHSADDWTSALSFQADVAKINPGPELGWRLGHVFKAGNRVRVYAPAVHTLHEEWHLRTFRLLEIWVEYTAPVDEETNDATSELWRRSFP